MYFIKNNILFPAESALTSFELLSADVVAPDADVYLAVDADVDAGCWSVAASCTLMECFPEIGKPRSKPNFLMDNLQYVIIHSWHNSPALMKKTSIFKLICTFFS